MCEPYSIRCCFRSGSELPFVRKYFTLAPPPLLSPPLLSSTRLLGKQISGGCATRGGCQRRCAGTQPHYRSDVPPQGQPKRGKEGLLYFQLVFLYRIILLLYVFLYVQGRVVQKILSERWRIWRECIAKGVGDVTVMLRLWLGPMFWFADYDLRPI